MEVRGGSAGVLLLVLGSGLFRSFAFMCACVCVQGGVILLVGGVVFRCKGDSMEWFV